MAESRKRFTIERRYHAHIDDVWDLWTTKAGFESWWGPGGFRAEVRSIDVRPGGELRYAMSAVDPGIVEFMRKSGLPVTTEARLTYREIERPSRLSYVHLADFVPGVEPYDVETVVELHRDGNAVHMRITFEAMHDDEWTKRSVMGWEGQVGKLDARFASAGA
jgi:uncharacterized protein YndB with AHSA1/START domain